MSSVKQLEAEELRIRKVFSADFDFEIPEYQRPYAWGKEQALQLLDDLDDALSRDTDEPYFLGSVVLVKTKMAPTAQVIDGQQRLTTLTILFAILRDLAQDDDLRKELGDLVREPGSKLAGTKAKPRLRLRERDAQFFHDFIQTPGKLKDLARLDPASLNDAQRAVRANCVELECRLRTWDENRRESLAAMLGSRTFLVVVSTPDLTSAHRIFSVMNSRGLDLSPADIFKAEVIGKIADEEQTKYADKWESEEEDLGRDNFADLFQHIRMIMAKEKGRRDLLRDFKDQVLINYLPDAAQEFVDAVLLPYSDAYENLLAQKYSAGRGSEIVNHWIQRLHQVDNNDWRPPALWALRHHGHDPTFVAQFLKKLERLSGSMLIRRIYATPRISRYAELLKELDTRGLGLEAPAFMLDHEERLDTVTKLRGDIYHTPPVRRYVLLRLDEMLAPDPGVAYDHKMITVEHVLPQNPRSDSDWVRNFTDDEREQWTHKLGNLVLLNRAKNSQAQNYDFPTKKQRYFGGANGIAVFAITQQVVHHDQWLPTTIQARQEELVTKLVNEWRLDED